MQDCAQRLRRVLVWADRPRTEPVNPMQLKYFCTLILSLLLGACSVTPQEPPPSPAPVAEATPQPEPAEQEPAEQPLRPFPADSVYDLLVAEFAIRRQQYDTALGHYLYQAQQTRDTGVVASAARLAQFINAETAALEASELWLELEPETPEANFIAASALARNGRPMEALPHMVQVLKAGDEANFAAISAAALGRSADVQQAFTVALEQLRQRYPQKPEVQTALALMYQYSQRGDEALQLVEQVLAQEPSNLHALLIQTQLLQQQGQFERAKERLKYAVDQHPHNKRLRLQLAALLAKTDLHQAKAQYTVLSYQFPNDPNIKLALALINQELGEPDQARELLQTAIQEGTQSAKAHYFLGRLEESKGNWQAAIDAYQQVQPGDEFIVAVSRLTDLHRQHMGLTSARQTLDQLRQRFPDQELRLYLIESDLLFQQKEWQQGHRLLSEALMLHPDEPNLLYARSLFSERLKNLHMVEQDLRNILRQDPDNAMALNALGYSLATMTDRLTEAKELVAKALANKPEDPAILDSFGWIAYRQGELAIARDYLERAYAQSKDHEIAAHLGEVLWKSGEQDRAKAVWKEGLEHTPDSHIIGETLERLQVKGL